MRTQSLHCSNPSQNFLVPQKGAVFSQSIPFPSTASSLTQKCQRSGSFHGKSLRHCSSQKTFLPLNQSKVANHEKLKEASDLVKPSRSNDNMIIGKDGAKFSDLKRQMRLSLGNSNTSMSSTKPNTSVQNTSRMQTGQGVLTKLNQSRTSSFYSSAEPQNKNYAPNGMVSGVIGTNSTYIMIDYTNEMPLTDEIIDATPLQKDEFVPSQKLFHSATKLIQEDKQKEFLMKKEKEGQSSSNSILSPDKLHSQRSFTQLSKTQRIEATNTVNNKLYKTNSWIERKNTSPNEKLFNLKEEKNDQQLRENSPYGLRKQMSSRESLIKDSGENKNEKINQGQDEKIPSRQFFRKGSLKSVVEETNFDMTKNISARDTLNIQLATTHSNFYSASQTQLHSSPLKLNRNLLSEQNSKSILNVLTISKMNQKQQNKSILSDIQDLKIDESSIKALLNLLERKKAEIYSLIKEFHQGYEMLEQITQEILSKTLETKSVKLLGRILMFIGQIQLGVGDIGKCAFYYNQARLCFNLISNGGELKSILYCLLGELSIIMNNHVESIKFYKKALQYAWYYSNVNSEIEIYEHIGMAYFYQQNLNKSEFYHQRSVNCDYEVVNSHLMRVANEVTSEYIKNKDLPANIIDQRIFSHLSLPLNFSNFDHIFHSTQKAQNNFMNYQTQQSQNPYKTLSTFQDINDNYTDETHQKDNYETTRYSYTQESRRRETKNITDNSAEKKSPLKNGFHIYNIGKMKSKSFHKSQSSFNQNGIACLNNSSFDKLDKQENKDKSQNANPLLNSQTQEDLKIRLLSEGEDEQNRLDQCLQSYLAKKYLYNNCDGQQIISHIMKDNEFVFEMTTPKHSVMREHPIIAIVDKKKRDVIFQENFDEIQQKKHQKMVQKSQLKQVSLTGYDVKQLGVVGARSSQRVFEDYSKYKIPLEKKIKILDKQNLSLKGIWRKIEQSLTFQKKFSTQFNDRIRLSQDTPNRCATNFENYPKMTLRKIKSSYVKLIQEILAVFDHQII